MTITSSYLLPPLQSPFYLCLSQKHAPFVNGVLLYHLYPQCTRGHTGFGAEMPSSGVILVAGFRPPKTMTKPAPVQAAGKRGGHPHCFQHAGSRRPRLHSANLYSHLQPHAGQGRGDHWECDGEESIKS